MPGSTTDRSSQSLSHSDMSVNAIEPGEAVEEVQPHVFSSHLFCQQCRCSCRDFFDQCFTCSNCCRQMFQFNDEDDIASILGDDDGRNSDPNS